ncbi:MAG: TauD/TfdA family dioxygenase [Burkholderiaceae bacterium]
MMEKQPHHVGAAGQFLPHASAEGSHHVFGGMFYGKGAVSFEIRPNPFDRSLGAEVHGLDLSQSLDETIVRTLETAWVRYKILIFVDQHIDDAQQISFTKYFGPLEEFPMTAVRANTHNEIFRVSNVDNNGQHLPADHNTVRYLHVTQRWHIDSSYRAVPSKGSVFRGIELTRHGGETWFCDLEQVYLDLPDTLREQIDGLHAVHDFEVSRRAVGNLAPLSAEEKAAVPAAVHPLVRTHPDSGRRSLFLSPVHMSHVVGMSAQQSKALLDELLNFALQDKYIYKHRWWPGDVLMWDNRSLMHWAQPFDEHVLRRVMHRTTLAGNAIASSGD